jgi:integrase
MALQILLVCCTPQTAEIVAATWSEIDGDFFRVPADRMKNGTARDIPLSRAAMALLADLPGDHIGYLFTGRTGKTVGGGVFTPFSGKMHEDAMQTLVREELQMDSHVHGLRATFRTWVTDHAITVCDHDAAEIAQDHVIESRVHRAYDRADMMAERRDLAERWVAFLLG